jgi:hypothetical protein
MLFLHLFLRQPNLQAKNAPSIIGRLSVIAIAPPSVTYQSTPNAGSKDTEIHVPRPHPSTNTINVRATLIIPPSIACEVLSLYNRSTLTTNKKAGYAVDRTTAQPYPNAETAAKGMAQFYQTFALSAGFFVSSKGGRE